MLGQLALWARIASSAILLLSQTLSPPFFLLQYLHRNFKFATCILLVLHQLL
uniref:Uncharacterized protein n=1 Tax=Arundo donax TaxID=35708 RepID=A0A0A8YR82_ARUDO